MPLHEHVWKPRCPFRVSSIHARCLVVSSRVLTSGRRSRAPLPDSSQLDQARPEREDLASDAFQGRDNGDARLGPRARTTSSKSSRRSRSGSTHRVRGDDAFRQPFPGGVNILGLDSRQQLPERVRHRGRALRPLRARQVPGARWPTTTSATVRPTTRRVSPPCSRSAGGSRDGPAVTCDVRSILALWDREEDGLLGSAYYVNHPLVPLDKTVGYVNFDIQGANLLPSLRNDELRVRRRDRRHEVPVDRRARDRTRPAAHPAAELRSSVRGAATT